MGSSWSRAAFIKTLSPSGNPAGAGVGGPERRHTERDGRFKGPSQPVKKPGCAVSGSRVFEMYGSRLRPGPVYHFGKGFDTLLLLKSEPSMIRAKNKEIPVFAANTGISNGGEGGIRTGRSWILTCAGFYYSMPQDIATTGFFKS